jgi:hypothetical protein
MKHTAAVFTAFTCLLSPTRSPAQTPIQFTKVTDLAPLGVPGWAAQTGLGVSFGSSTSNGVPFLDINADIFESWCDIRFIRTDLTAAPIRTRLNLVLKNIGNTDWRGFLINIIQPVLPDPARLANEFFGPSQSAFTHTIYAHFHPSTDTQTSGPISNQDAWSSSFRELVCFIPPFGGQKRCRTVLRSFTPLDQTANFGYDANLPMGPPTGFHVTWSVSPGSGATAQALRIHASNPGAVSLVPGQPTPTPQDPNFILRITPDYVTSFYP